MSTEDAVGRANDVSDDPHRIAEGKAHRACKGCGGRHTPVLERLCLEQQLDGARRMVALLRSGER